MAERKPFLLRIDSAVLDAVRFIQRHAHVDRLEATVEAHIMSTARVRERQASAGSIGTRPSPTGRGNVKETSRRATTRMTREWRHAIGVNSTMNYPNPGRVDLLERSAGLNMGLDFLPGALPFAPAVGPRPDPELAAFVLEATPVELVLQLGVGLVVGQGPAQVLDRQPCHHTPQSELTCKTEAVQ